MEVVTALIVMGLLVASVPPSMIAIINYQTRQNEKRIAENIARNQIEYIKAQDYIWGNDTYPIRYDIIRPEINFGISVEAVPLSLSNDPETGNPWPADYWEPYTDEETGNVTIFDEGVQEITVTAWGFGGSPLAPKSTRPVFEIKFYKTDYEGRL